jgi:hypothetical protein
MPKLSNFSLLNLISIVRELVRSEKKIRLNGLNGLNNDVMHSYFHVFDDFSLPSFEKQSQSTDDLDIQKIEVSLRSFQTFAAIKTTKFSLLKKSLKSILDLVVLIASRIVFQIKSLPLVADVFDTHQIPIYLTPRIAPSPITPRA